ncbi:MAG: DUF1015 domain-containing protein [Clostridia bacterium]|nr:DUF1015 domain-containing protein [Clostridia bacterium]
MECGILAGEILLPNVEDLTAFSCVACDQFTSEIEYWNNLKELVGNKKSALNLILPEIYLNDNLEQRIKTINKNIEEYLKGGVFKKLQKGFILTVRKTPFVEKRIGLIGLVDLEKYEYAKKSQALIRSTEGTIEERIPPRLKIRENAKMEFPHIMVLFDDEKREITEDLYSKKDTLEKVYDFDLNMGGGKIEGYFVKDYQKVLDKFSNLLSEERLVKKYGTIDKFAFAVGDGNHSLATAKAHWEKVKKNLTEKERETHPARYALAEFVNIYDEGIYFEPIHRFIKGVDREKFIKGLKEKSAGKLKIYNGNKYFETKANLDLPEVIRATDEYVKEYINAFGGEVDYVHGDKNIKDLVDKSSDTVGVLFDKLDKADLFRFVSKNGALPRKTFSMGEGVEKRYYLEGRIIRND